MIFLIATVLLNTLLAILFKLFPRYNVNTLQAIVVNYWVCVITGSVFLGSFPVSAESVQQSWFPWALLMGVSFISVFNLIGYCTRTSGITTATIANKLSLVIPVLISILLYHESTGIWKIAGIILALPAVYFTAHEKEKSNGSIFWPVLLFIGSGLLDALVKYVEQGYLPTPAVQAVYTVHVFGVAAVAGTSLLLIQLIRKKAVFAWRNVLAGICLGIPNYFSIYFLIRLFNSHFLQSSAALPVNNICIVITSALAAILLFREKATPVRILGLVLSVIAIMLIIFADLYAGRI
jgi:hypothetical protein